jgi:phosphate transport system substrate-binding protein
MKWDLGCIKCALIGALATAFMLSPAAPPQIHAAGASFPYPVFSRWADSYRKETGASVNYQSLGSGAGIRQAAAHGVAFGASERPLQAAELAAAGLVQWPQLIGGVTPVVHLDGVAPGELIFDGPTLARIFLGEITRWDDDAIRRLNPDAKLPDLPIIVVHRSDASGTTFTLSSYFSKVSPDWRARVGADIALAWPIGVGSKGNEGVAIDVARMRGALGYLEFAFAKQNHLAYARMINRAGRVVAPSGAAFRAAADHADWANAPGFHQLLTDQPGPDAWPIAAATFILMPKSPDNPAVVRETVKFFDWAFRQGRGTAEDLDYVAPSPELIALIRRRWADELPGLAPPAPSE